MNESVKALLELLLKDETSAKKVLGCESKEEAYAEAMEMVGGYTREEFEEGMLALIAIVQKKEGRELSDEDLDGVAGGALRTTSFEVNDLVMRTPSKHLGRIALKSKFSDLVYRGDLEGGVKCDDLVYREGSKQCGKVTML